MKELSCYSIGHSNHSIDAFVRMLLAHGVNCAVDVRSAPDSRRQPQFNRESIKTDLKLADIRYLYLGDSLGARHSKPSVLHPGRPGRFQPRAPYARISGRHRPGHQGH